MSGINTLGFSMCFLPLSALKEMGRIKSYEECRDSGNLRAFDTYEQACGVCAWRYRSVVSSPALRAV